LISARQRDWRKIKNWLSHDARWDGSAAFHIMQLGVDSFVATARSGATGDAVRVQELLEQIELADQVGLDVFGIGEHHRPDYVSSAPAVLLAAAAARTKRIRLASAVTVLSSDDPVRVFQQFATVDLISQGRAEIVAGRGSFIESYPLFGFDLEKYDALFAEKLELLLKIREQTNVHWSGKHRAALTGQGVYPRALQHPLPVWIGVGGTPASVVRAGRLGLPLMVAIIGGQPAQFRPLIDLYRESGRQAGHPPEKLVVGIHAIGFLADTTRGAIDTFWPAYRDAFGRIGRERGWPPPNRPQFDAQCSTAGALMVGDPEAVAAKILSERETLGDVSRMTILIDNRVLTHPQILRAIELLGTRVAPVVRRELASAADPMAPSAAF
jgi:probable LLM family oxidoreductase